MILIIAKHFKYFCFTQPIQLFGGKTFCKYCLPPASYEMKGICDELMDICHL